MNGSQILAVMSMFIYAGGLITLVVYIIRLFRRLVMGVEKIADSLENCRKNKTDLPI